MAATFDTASLQAAFRSVSQASNSSPASANAEPLLGRSPYWVVGQFRKRRKHVRKKCLRRSDSLFDTHRLSTAPRVPIQLATVRRTFLT
jgi:hypothetical protein